MKCQDYGKKCFFMNWNLFQGKSGVCHTCRFPSFRLHACLHCVYFGCYTTKHIHEHAFSKNHNLGMKVFLSFSFSICLSPQNPQACYKRLKGLNCDFSIISFNFTAADMTYGTIFCFECGDYVYDKELESIAQIQNEKAAKSLGIAFFKILYIDFVKKFLLIITSIDRI